MADCINALKEWTGKASATVVYDSTVDEFTHNGLFEKVKGKRNIAIIATTTDGDVFGAYYSVAVTQQEQYFQDPDMFIFSFESHGRCMTPQRFMVKEEWKGGASVEFFKNVCGGRFVLFNGGGGWFSLGNEKSRTWCFQLSHGFNGIDDTTLTGEPEGSHSGNFTCCRLVAVQLSH